MSDYDLRDQENYEAYVFLRDTSVDHIVSPYYGLARVREAFRTMRENGAAVAFGLMGMAEAIRERDPQRASWFHYERYQAAAARYAEAINAASYVGGDGRTYKAWMP
jgi:hypothetical protein